MRCTINDKRCRDLVARPPKKTTLYWDTSKDCDGFVFRVTPTGAAAYLFVYRVDQRQRKFRIAKHGDLSVAKVRKMYRELRAKVAEGKDPAGQRADELAAPTVRQLLESYWTANAHRWGQKTQSNYRDYELAVDAAFGARKVHDIRKPEVIAWHLSMRRTPANANLCKRYLSAVMAHAVELEYIVRNPVAGVAEFEQEDRSCYLTADQARRVMVELGKDRHVEAANMLVFMAVTGCRKGEAAQMEFAQVADGPDGPVWIKPKHRVKQKRQHVTTLGRKAMELIEFQRDLHSNGQVFRRPEGRPGPLDPKSCWQRVRRNLGLGHVRAHDLRHSFASLLISNGKTLDEIGQLLGHSKADTTRRYASLHVGAMRESTDLIESILFEGE